jgi:hypothetical protein
MKLREQIATFICRKNAGKNTAAWGGQMPGMKMSVPLWLSLLRPASEPPGPKATFTRRAADGRPSQTLANLEIERTKRSAYALLGEHAAGRVQSLLRHLPCRICRLCWCDELWMLAEAARVYHLITHADILTNGGQQVPHHHRYGFSVVSLPDRATGRPMEAASRPRLS